MGRRVLIAGIGNIFQGDDFFGVEVIHRLAQNGFDENVRLMDVGIRSIDLGFALLDEYDLTILIDATARGGSPGTLYTIGIEPEHIPDTCEEALVNSHGLNAERVLILAKSMGAPLKNVVLVGCEPLVLDHDQSGHIGLSAVVEAAVGPAIETIQRMVAEFAQDQVVPNKLKEGEVCCHERI